MRRIALLATGLVVSMGCGAGSSGAEDPAPGFGRVQTIIDKRDRNDPIPQLHLAMSGPRRGDKVVHTGAEWKKVLPPEAYAILRERGTEKPKSSPLLNEHGQGAFVCAACGNPLFASGDKYDSGSGWPSFVGPVKGNAVWYRLDRDEGLHRVEILCARCDGHLGHVFDDGPKARGGLRYCIDGAALRFLPEGK